MKLRYAMTMDDLMALNILIAKQTKQSRKPFLTRKFFTRIGIGIGIGFFVTVLLYAISAVRGVSVTVSYEGNLLREIRNISIAMVIGICFYYFWVRLFHVIRVWQTHVLEKKGFYTSFLRPRELEITNDGLVTRTNSTTSIRLWHTIERIVSFGEHVFIMIDQRGAYIIPRQRILEGDVKAFISELEQHLVVQKAASE